MNNELKCGIGSPNNHFEQARLPAPIASSEEAAPVASDALWEANLMEAVELTIDTLDCQLDLIAERAPGRFLDKTPVIRSLTAHKQRLERALAERNASSEEAAVEVHVHLTKGGLEVSEPVVEFSKAFESRMDAEPGKVFKLYTPPAAAQPSRDSARFRFLTEDFDNADLRHARNELLDRMATMTYSSVCLQIDALLKEHGVELDVAENSASVVQKVAAQPSRAEVLERAANLCDQLSKEFLGGAAYLCAKTLRRFNEQLDQKETRQ